VAVLLPADVPGRRTGRRPAAARPGAAEGRLGVDEVVTTLLLNFIVLLAVSALLDGPMKDPTAMGWPQSVALQGRAGAGASWSPKARACTPGCWAPRARRAAVGVFKYTVFGFDVRALGANPRAAAFAGVPPLRTVVCVALLSGALAGLAGAIEVAGRTGYVTLDMSPGYGYSGIVIAMLAGLHPLGLLAAAVFVAGVLVGADSMSRVIGVPTYIADVIVAASLIVRAGGDAAGAVPGAVAKSVIASTRTMSCRA
jgi:ABC-type uncharacterized transport system permease subunit